jgi:predicted RNase H-like nuclease (RuvC/YqgF family)
MKRISFYDSYTREDLIALLIDAENEIDDLKIEIDRIDYDNDDLRETLKTNKLMTETINEHCRDCDNKYSNIKCLECKLNQFKYF